MNEMLELIRDTTSRIFKDNCSHEVLERAESGSWPEKLWTDVKESGIPFVLLPDEQGGAGLSWDEACSVMRVAGYYAVPLPLVETMVAAWLMYQSEREVTERPMSLAPCFPGEELTAERVGGKWKVTGVCPRVPWGRSVHGFWAPVRRQGALEFVWIEQGAGAVTEGMNLAFEPRDTIRLDSVSAPEEAFVAWGDGDASALTLGALLRVQQVAGATQRALDFSTQYAGERVQFGRPLAKFQAIQQQLAVMAGEVAAARAGADETAASWGTDKAGFLVASAKARAGESATRVAAIAHQVHGAMGFTREHSLHFTTRRLWSWRDEFGGDTFWQRWLGHRVLELGADELWPFLVREPVPTGEGLER